jgi:hypothetical protein
LLHAKSVGGGGEDFVKAASRLIRIQAVDSPGMAQKEIGAKPPIHFEISRGVLVLLPAILLVAAPVAAKLISASLAPVTTIQASISIRREQMLRRRWRRSA